jgi:hypothetical protein
MNIKGTKVSFRHLREVVTLAVIVVNFHLTIQREQNKGSRRKECWAHSDSYC